MLRSLSLRQRGLLLFLLPAAWLFMRPSASWAAPQQQQTLADLPLPAQAALGKDQPIYHAHPQGMGFSSDNPQHALTATPDAGSSFAGWSGDADCSDGSVTMDAAKACAETFNLTTYTPTYATGPHGTISGTSPQTVASGGSAWTHLGPETGMPNVAVFDLKVHQVTRRVVAFTHGRGAFMLVPAGSGP